MRVVLTRPGQDAGEWEQVLRRRGHEVLAAPLIAIGSAPDADALARARSGLHRFTAVMFVSGNAVRGLSGAAGLAWPPGTRAWATGPGTVKALRAAGVPRDSIDAPAADAAQFDSEHLWQVAGHQVQRDSRVLIVRGADAQGRTAGRDWLAGRLEQAGASVETVAAYTRGLPAWDARQLASATTATGDGSIWLFSSSEAVGNLRLLLPHADWKRAAAIATHDRIAQAAKETGFGVVRTSRPDLDAVVAALESTG